MRAGQANYGFGNLASSQLCRFRRQQGLPGLSVGWGPVGNVGFVVDNSDSLVSPHARCQRQSAAGRCGAVMAPADVFAARAEVDGPEQPTPC